MAKITEAPAAAETEHAAPVTAPASYRALSIGGVIGGAVVVLALTFGGGVAVGMHFSHGDSRGFSQLGGPGDGAPGGMRGGIHGGMRGGMQGGPQFGPQFGFGGGSANGNAKGNGFGGANGSGYFQRDRGQQGTSQQPPAQAPQSGNDSGGSTTK